MDEDLMSRTPWTRTPSQRACLNRVGENPYAKRVGEQLGRTRIPTQRGRLNRMNGSSYAQRVKEQPGRELLRTTRVAGSLKRMDEDPNPQRTVEQPE